MYDYTTLPYESMLCGFRPPYVDPAQSKYHNLGMNGYIHPGQSYPGKRPGFVGDYSVRQEGDRESVKHGVYPLDEDILRFNNDNNYRMLPYLAPRLMSPKSAAIMAAGINQCKGCHLT
jgi:hypothetical protein